METYCGVHHFFGGMGMAVIGYLLLSFKRRWIVISGLTIALAGALMMTDDIWQHCLQHVYKDNYASPCKRIYWAVNKRCPFVYNTVRDADRLFRGTLFDKPASDPNQSETK